VIEEQSPFNIADFIKQRNRWQKAIFLNALNSPELTLKLKIFLFYNVFTFFGSPIVLFNTLMFWANLICFACYETHFAPMIKDAW
jgi:hypothetical protein